MRTITTQTHTLVSGVELHYATVGVPSPAALVFIHGWPDSWYSFARVLDSLPTSNYSIALSLRGFGDSSVPDDGYAIEQFAADTGTLLDHLGVSSLVCVGHSMGSLVAQRLAADRPDLTTGVVLIGGFVSLGDDLVAEIAEIVADLSDPVDEQFVREFQSSTLAGLVPPEFFERLIDESRKAPARVWRDAFRAIIESRASDAAGRITVPTLLLWGDRDALVPRAEQESLQAAIARSELVVCEGSGHSPNWERPEWVAEKIATFAERLAREERAQADTAAG